MCNISRRGEAINKISASDAPERSLQAAFMIIVIVIMSIAIIRASYTFSAAFRHGSREIRTG